ncbi:UNVERIFIED_CONTAM: hypothetical protein Sradi_5571500 [Sesamum radiatum]|uniref:DUF4283 domain-containing protein n=1 Tax=Sesamum radiatum TaxID=300843 RepID=A0AAW2L038_SESRA
MAHPPLHSEIIIGALPEIASLVADSADSANSSELTRPSHPVQQQKQQKQQTKSFAEALRGSSQLRDDERQTPQPSEFPKFFLADSNEASIGSIHNINGRPTLVFSDSETESLAADFRLALIGKFSHGSPPYSQLHRLLAKSGLKGTFTVSMINNKHALISLSDESDYNRLGCAEFGTLMARVCVEVDLLKPLLEEIDLKICGTTIVQKIEYEQVPQYCSLCKHVGHKDSECYSKGDAPKPPRRGRAAAENRQIMNRRYVPTSVSAPISNAHNNDVNENASRVVENDAIDDVNTQLVDAENDAKIVEIAENEKNDNAGMTVARNVEVDGIDDANAYVNDAYLEDNVGKNGFNDTNVNLSVGAHLSNYVIIEAFERWKKRPKRIKLKEAVQLFKNLKHLGRVCPGARYCKDTFEKGSRFVEAIAKAFNTHHHQTTTHLSSPPPPEASPPPAPPRRRRCAAAGRLPEISPALHRSRPPSSESSRHDLSSHGARALIRHLTRRQWSVKVAEIKSKSPMNRRKLLSNIPADFRRPIARDRQHPKNRSVRPYSRLRRRISAARRRFPVAPLPLRSPFHDGLTCPLCFRQRQLPGDDVIHSQSIRVPSLAESTRQNSTHQTQNRSFSEAAALNSEKSKSPPSDFKKFFLAGSKSTSIGTVNTINGRPTIIFSDEETQSLAADFRYALVGKFSHGSPPYSLLHRLLSNLGIKGAFTVSLINNKHALINLTNESDYSRLWMRRIWYLKGFPMRVFKWSPTFTPDQESSVVPIWVSFPDLPAHLFCKDALHTIATFVGTPLQIADSTFSRSMLSRARVCTEIDLLKPLVKELDLQINGRTFVQKVEFEQVPQYCSLCKHVGHHDLECYTKGNAPKPPQACFWNKRGDYKTNERQGLPPEIGECSKAFEPSKFIVDDSDEHDITVAKVDVANEAHIVDAMPENTTVEVHVEHDVSVVENDTIIEHAIMYIENENENVEGVVGCEKEPLHNDNCASGALIVRLDSFSFDLKKKMSSFEVDNALRLFDTFKQFGKVMKEIEVDVQKRIKRNGLALRSAKLYQECVLIFYRISQLYLKPLDGRSPPIATRTRRRKKGKNPLNRRTTYTTSNFLLLHFVGELHFLALEFFGIGCMVGSWQDLGISSFGVCSCRLKQQAWWGFFEWMMELLL